MASQAQLYLIAKVRKLLKNNQTLEDFIGKWIWEGGTFQSLHQYLLAHGIETTKFLVWYTFRHMLKSPYNHINQYTFKWNSIAKSKGFVNAKQMLLAFKSMKATKNEVMRELGIRHLRDLDILREVFLEDKNPFGIQPKKHKVLMKKEGFVRKDTIEKWDKKLFELGYENLTQAIEEMKKEGLKYTHMARRLGVSPRYFRWRRMKMEKQICREKQLLKPKLRRIINRNEIEIQ